MRRSKEKKDGRNSRDKELVKQETALPKTKHSGGTVVNLLRPTQPSAIVRSMQHKYDSTVTHECERLGHRARRCNYSKFTHRAQKKWLPMIGRIK